MMERMMIIGCTSGIGLALAELSIAQGFLVGGVGRNADKLEELEQKFPHRVFGEIADIRHAENLSGHLDLLVQKTGGMDICVVASSIARKNKELDFSIEQDVLRTNVLGYASALVWAARYFQKQNYGHLIGLTSLAKFLGSPNPAYTASKAFESRYLDGLRLNLAKTNVTVSEVMPGFVRTPMTENQGKMFWAISAEKAAGCILKAMRRKKQKVVISWRWKLFYCLLPHIPFTVLKRVLSQPEVE